MEETRILIGLALVFSFWSSFCIGMFLLDSFSVREKRRRVLKVSGISDSVFSIVLREGIRPLYRVADVLLKNSAIRKFCFDFVRVVKYRELEASLASSASLIVGISGFIFLLGSIFGSSPLVGFLASLCLILGINAWVKYEEESRIEALRDQIPNALQSMKACFFVGYSLPQTLRQVGRETTGVLSQIFQNTYGVLETGGTVYQALDYLKNQSNHPELLFLASALDIQHKTGSSMQQVLDVAHDLVTEELELERSLKTQTAQARLSAQIVTVMPFILLLLFSFISPGFLDPFFESFIGIVMLAGALFMQLIGVLMVRKMLKIKV